MKKGTVSIGVNTLCSYISIEDSNNNTVKTKSLRETSNLKSMKDGIYHDHLKCLYELKPLDNYKDKHKYVFKYLTEDFQVAYISRLKIGNIWYANAILDENVNLEKDSNIFTREKKDKSINFILINDLNKDITSLIDKIHEKHKLLYKLCLKD